MPSQFEEIFNQVSHFTGLLEPDGTVIEANDTALEFAGLDQSEVIGQKLWRTYWFQGSEDTQRQVRADVERATQGEFVRHDITVQGEDRTTVIDFSLRPVTDDEGKVKQLLPEGQILPTARQTEETRRHSLHEQPDSSLLVAYSRDAEEPMSEAIVSAFLAIDVDVFEKNQVLQDWFETDILDGVKWRSERPLSIAMRLWGYPVVLTADEVRIYTDSSLLD